MRLIDKNIKLITVFFKITISTNSFEFVNKCSNYQIAFILQYRFQSLARSSSYRSHLRISKIITNLFVEINAVSYYDKTRLFFCFFHLNSTHKHNHGQTLTATLRMPNNAARRIAVIFTVYTVHRFLYSKELLMPRNLFYITII